MYNSGIKALLTEQGSDNRWKSIKYDTLHMIWLTRKTPGIYILLKLTSFNSYLSCDNQLSINGDNVLYYNSISAIFVSLHKVWIYYDLPKKKIIIIKVQFSA